MTDEQREIILGALRDRSFRERVGTRPASVRTGRGDQGRTCLLFSREVPKYHPRIRILGQIDQLNAVIGLGKNGASEPDLHLLNRVQESLVYLMAEVATLPEDMHQFQEFFHQVSDSDVDQLAEAIRQREESNQGFSKWVESFELSAGFLELGRTQIRIIESHLWELVEKDELRPLLPQWMNQLADLFWLLSRAGENRSSR